jgi:hypothetical protein
MDVKEGKRHITREFAGRILKRILGPLTDKVRETA